MQTRAPSTEGAFYTARHDYIKQVIKGKYSLQNPEVVNQLKFLYQVCIKSRGKKKLKEAIRYAKI